jgi:hypothetical protein
MKKTFIPQIVSTAMQACLAIALLFSIGKSSAQVVVWDDSFDGPSINSNLTVVTGGSGAAVTQTGGQLIMDTGSTTNTGRAQIVTDKTSTGATTIGSDLVFDYMANAVTATFNIARVTTDSDGLNNSRPTFFFTIGQDAGSIYYPNTGLDYGVGIALEYLDGLGYWRFAARTANNTVATEDYLGNLSALPTSVTYTINNTAASISIAGATFTSGGTGTSSSAITFGDLSGVAAFTQRNLAFGAFNAGTVDPQTVATLNAFQVTVVPEPSTFALIAGSLTAMMVYRRRRR